MPGRPPGPSGWFDRAVGLCLGALMCAAALYAAVQLIEAVATALIVIVLVGLFVAGSVAILRARNGGW